MDKKTISEAAAAMGRKGAAAKLKKYGPGQYSEMGKKGMAKRWGKKEEPEDIEKPLDKEDE